MDILRSSFVSILAEIDPIHSPFTIVLAGIAVIALIFWYLATEVDRIKRNVGTVAVLIVTLLCILAIIPPKEKIKGGIDLIGGIKYTVEIQPTMDEGRAVPVSTEAIQQVKNTLSDRLNPSGQKDLLIQGMGANRLVIEMPGTTVEEAEEIEATIVRTAKLELKEVHPENSRLAPLVEAKEEIVPAGYQAYEMDIKDKDNKVVGTELILLKRRNIVTGDQVARALATGSYGVIDVKLNSEGGDRLLKATSEMTLGQDRMAVVMDDKCLIAPTVQAKLKSSFIIEGLDGQKEVNQVVAALGNPLKNSLTILSSSRISAKLGKSVVKQGIVAGLIGLTCTFIFVLIYYRKAGIIALIGLTLNMLILFGAMAMLGATFTLAGIAGIVLTIGIAVDANVLIYERLREEMAAGKSPKHAVRASYEKAFSAIFDANITSLLTALVLFWLASSTIKGFAVTLTIGIIGSMFTALLATRVMFLWIQNSKLMNNLSFMNLIPDRAFDFLGKRKICFAISGLLLAISFIATGVKGKSALGIDFVGGSVLEIQMDEGQIIPAQEFKDALADMSGLQKEPQIQEEHVPGSNEHITIRCADSDVELIKAEILKDIPALAGQEISDDSMSPALGKEFFIGSLIALGVGLISILIYISIRYEFSFAIGAFAALVHDIIITTGLIILLGAELSMIHVGALLTIAGYSINDTIIIFDRIRETLTQKRGDVYDIMNEAISNTLSRTIITSITTILTVLILSIFGGAGLKDFSVAILVGLVVGTYSSVFIASPIVYIWSKMRGSNLQREVLDGNLEAELSSAKK